MAEQRWLSDGDFTELGGEQENDGPLSKYAGKWYFYDETYSEMYGPFDEKEDARKACESYAKTL
jgi:hypothetical protein